MAKKYFIDKRVFKSGRSNPFLNTASTIDFQDIIDNYSLISSANSKTLTSVTFSSPNLTINYSDNSTDIVDLSTLLSNISNIDTAVVSGTYDAATGDLNLSVRDVNDPNSPLTLIPISLNDIINGMVNKVENGLSTVLNTSTNYPNDLTVQLGGSLIKNTIINQGGYHLTFDGTNKTSNFIVVNANDVNLQGEEININSDQNIILGATDYFGVTVGGMLEVSVTDQIEFTSDDSYISLDADSYISLEANTDISLEAGNDVKVEADNSIDMVSNNDLISIFAGTDLTLKAKGGAELLSGTKGVLINTNKDTRLTTIPAGDKLQIQEESSFPLNTTSGQALITQTDTGIVKYEKVTDISKVLFVDANTTTNVQGQKGNLNRPYKTYVEAMDKAIVGDLIYLFPGEYTVESGDYLFKYGVRIHALNGAVLTDNRSGTNQSFNVFQSSSNQLNNTVITYYLYEKNENFVITGDLDLNLNWINISGSSSLTINMFEVQSVYNNNERDTFFIDINVKKLTINKFSSFLFPTGDININAKTFVIRENGTLCLQSPGFNVPVSGFDYFTDYLFNLDIENLIIDRREVTGLERDPFLYLGEDGQDHRSSINIANVRATQPDLTSQVGAFQQAYFYLSNVNNLTLNVENFLEVPIIDTTTTPLTVLISDDSSYYNILNVTGETDGPLNINFNNCTCYAKLMHYTAENNLGSDASGNINVKFNAHLLAAGTPVSSKDGDIRGNEFIYIEKTIEEKILGFNKGLNLELNVSIFNPHRRAIKIMDCTGLEIKGKVVHCDSSTSEVISDGYIILGQGSIITLDNFRYLVLSNTGTATDFIQYVSTTNLTFSGTASSTIHSLNSYITSQATTNDKPTTIIVETSTNRNKLLI